MTQITSFNIALESGSDFTTIDFSQMFRIGRYAKMKRCGFPTPGIYVLDDNGDWLWKDDEILAWIKENDLHPTWMREEKG